MDGLVKIREYRLFKKGDGGYGLSIPKEWVKDVKALPGENVTMYRDTSDRLVLEYAGRKS